MLKRLSLSLLLFPLIISAQGRKPEGYWAGTLDAAGVPIDIRFQISPRYSGWVSSLDVPAQRISAFRMSKTTWEKQQLLIESSEIGFTYTARRQDSNHMVGTYTQGGKSSKLVLTRQHGIWPVPKPQTPKPPFPYVQREVRIPIAGGNITAFGTLSLPDTLGRHPAIILISGSGAQDRDGSMGNHKPFALLADTFTKLGFAVLRCDDRGAGKTLGNPRILKNTTTADQALDVALFMKHLRSLPYIDTQRIGLLGHSEGGIIAPMVAAGYDSSVAFMILMAAPAQGGRAINMLQNEMVLKKTGMKGRQLRSYMKLHGRLLDGIVMSRDTGRFHQVFDSMLGLWEKQESTWLLRKKISGSPAGKVAMYKQYSGLMMPWMKFFLSHDPATDLQRIHCPVLALNGDRDIQVPAGENLNLIRAHLPAATLQRSTVQALPGLNHLFQQCRECTVREYFELEQTMSPAAIGIMADWLKLQAAARP